MLPLLAKEVEIVTTEKVGSIPGTAPQKGGTDTAPISWDLPPTLSQQGQASQPTLYFGPADGNYQPSSQLSSWASPAENAAGCFGQLHRMIATECGPPQKGLFFPSLQRSNQPLEPIVSDESNSGYRLIILSRVGTLSTVVLVGSDPPFLCFSARSHQVGQSCPMQGRLAMPSYRLFAAPIFSSLRPPGSLGLVGSRQPCLLLVVGWWVRWGSGMHDAPIPCIDANLQISTALHMVIRIVHRPCRMVY